jgi:hypothetical protein
MSRSIHYNIRTIYLMGFFQGFMVVLPVFVPLVMPIRREPAAQAPAAA